MNDRFTSSSENVFYSTAFENIDRTVNVFLPGWGFDGKIITLQDQNPEWIYPEKALPPAETIQHLSGFLETNGIHSITLSGWSMGAYMALDFALKHPGKIHALYLLATRASWPKSEIDQIFLDLKADRDSFLKSFYRKCFLGYKKHYKIFKSELIDRLLSDLDGAALEAGLKYLAEFNSEALLAELAKHSFPIYMVNGSKDIISPINEAPQNDKVTSIKLDRGGHPVFLEEDFPFHLHLRKKTIRNKFCRAADTYDQNAVVQKNIAEKLGASLPSITPAKILEIGCGTGNFTRIISDRYPSAEITALDFADDMLKIARRKVNPEIPICFLAADGEDFLKTSHEKFDLITSNATMQWFDNLIEATLNIRSLLTSEGQVLLSVFGPESMKEMRSELKTITGREVPIPASFFPGKDTISEVFSRIFAETEVNEWKIVKEYNSMNELLDHIRRTGTSGWHPGKPILTRHRIVELEKRFIEKYGTCCVTYQVFQIKCRQN